MCLHQTFKRMYKVLKQLFGKMKSSLLPIKSPSTNVQPASYSTSPTSSKHLPSQQPPSCSKNFKRTDTLWKIGLADAHAGFTNPALERRELKSWSGLGRLHPATPCKTCMGWSTTGAPAVWHSNLILLVRPPLANISEVRFQLKHDLNFSRQVRLRVLL